MGKTPAVAVATRSLFYNSIKVLLTNVESGYSTGIHKQRDHRYTGVNIQFF